LTTLSNVSNIPSRHLTTKLVLNTQKNDLKKHLLFKTPTSKAAGEVKNHQNRRTPLRAAAAASTIVNDRYIPNRVGTNMEISYHLLQQPKNTKLIKMNRPKPIKILTKKKTPQTQRTVLSIVLKRDSLLTHAMVYKKKLKFLICIVLIARRIA